MRMSRAQQYDVMTKSDDLFGRERLHVRQERASWSFVLL